MAKSTNVKSSLFIRYHYGQDDKGREIFKTQKFNTLKTVAADEDIYDVGIALGNLLPDNAVEVFRENTYAIA